MDRPVIALGAGHGYHTKGKRLPAYLDKNQTREWFLNDRIADRVELYLQEYVCTVLRVDDTSGKKDISLGTRVKTANQASADIYLSIHHNAGIEGGTGGGTVVFGYPEVAYMQKALRLYNTIIAKTNLRGNRSNPVSDGKHLYVIRKTAMPAFLIENGFMDSTTDAPIILTEAHASKTAQAIAEFLIEELQLEHGSAESKHSIEKYYPVSEKRYVTLAAALDSVGVNSSFSFRKRIAAANGVKGYIGTAAQNIQILNLLKAGLLKRAE